MSTLVLHGGEEVLYFIQLSATNEPMISKIERKSVAKKDFHIYLLCSVCLVFTKTTGRRFITGWRLHSLGPFYKFLPPAK